MRAVAVPSDSTSARPRRSDASIPCTARPRSTRPPAALCRPASNSPSGGCHAPRRETSRRRRSTSAPMGEVHRLTVETPDVGLRRDIALPHVVRLQRVHDRMRFKERDPPIRSPHQSMVSIVCSLFSAASTTVLGSNVLGYGCASVSECLGESGSTARAEASRHLDRHTTGMPPLRTLLRSSIRIAHMNYYRSMGCTLQYANKV